jgi:uncharacterized protein (DUF58 family)
MLLVIAVESKSVWVQAVACGLFALLVVSAFSLARGRETVRVTHPKLMRVGEPVDVTITVTSTVTSTSASSRRGHPIVVRYSLVAAHELLPPVTLYLDPGPAGRTATAAARVTPVARGVAEEARWSIERVGAFGLLTVNKAQVTRHQVVVAPALAEPVDIALRGGALGAGAPVRAGLDVSGVREWRPGDGVRHVHWRSTARAGRLVVMERHEQAHAVLGVVIVGAAGEPGFEELLARAAATVDVAIAQGVRCCFATEHSNPLNGKSIGHLAFFAHVELFDLPSRESLEDLAGALGEGATVLGVLSPAVSEPARGWLADAVEGLGLSYVELGAR